MQLTKLSYLDDFSLMQDEAIVLQVIQENNTIIILDHTIFYPQGGGQPYDKGIIENNNGKFIVEEVRFVDGIVKHIGKFEYGTFNVNDKVKCLIDKDRRELHSRLHSAGHVIDMAIDELKLGWIPGKAYHFPEGPYVEYSGNLENIDKEKLKTDIENLSNKFVNEAIETKPIFMDKAKMKEVCRHVPDFLPEGKPSRVVMYGKFGVPCGGTHVTNLKNIKQIIIRKIKQEKTNIRVSYDIER